MEKINNLHLNGFPENPIPENEEPAIQRTNAEKAFDVVAKMQTNRHTDSVQVIMTKVPSWVVSWGISIFFSILVMVFTIADFIYFPETINTDFSIQSTELVKKVLTPAAGVITGLYIKLGDSVKKGQQLLSIQSADDRNQIYIIRAPQTGRVVSTAIVDTGYAVNSGQELFAIHSGNRQVHGIIKIPVDKISEIKPGQDVFMMLNNNAIGYEQATGKIGQISDEPINGFFMVSVDLNYSKQKKLIEIESWMKGTAKVVIRKTTILNRILREI